MTSQRRYFIAAFTNWLAFAATLAVAFFLSPFLIRSLGNARYGIWVFVESILAYFTLFDLGIAACVVRYVARFNTANERDQLNRLVSTCLALFLGLGLTAMLLGLLLTPLLAPMLSKSGMEHSEVASFMVLMLGNLALSLPCSVFPSILDGLERFAAQSAIRITFLATRTILMVVLVTYKPSLLGLGIILGATNLAEFAAMAVLCRFYLPELKFGVRFIDRETLKLIKGYSIDAFLAMIGGRLSIQAGAIIIGLLRTAPEITWFAIGLRLVEFAKSLLRAATTTLTPAISSLEAAGDLERIRLVLFKATRWVLYLILPINLGLIVFGQPFLRIWLGSAVYSEHCYPVLCILSASLSFVVSQSVASRILYGMGKLRLYARLALAEAAASFALSLILVIPYGIAGVAVAMAVPSLLNSLIILTVTCRVLSVPVANYLRSAWCPPLLASLLILGVWLRGWEVRNWGDFIIAIFAGVAPYAACLFTAEMVLPRLLAWLSLRSKVFGRSRRAIAGR